MIAFSLLTTLNGNDWPSACTVTLIHHCSSLFLFHIVPQTNLLHGHLLAIQIKQIVVRVRVVHSLRKDAASYANQVNNKVGDTLLTQVGIWLLTGRSPCWLSFKLAIRRQSSVCVKWYFICLHFGTASLWALALLLNWLCPFCLKVSLRQFRVR